MEPRWRKTISNRRVALRRIGLRRLHSEKPGLHALQEWIQTVNRRHCPVYPFWTRISHQKGTLLSQLPASWIRRWWAQTLLAGLLGVGDWNQQGSPRVRLVPDVFSDGHSAECWPEWGAGTAYYWAVFEVDGEPVCDEPDVVYDKDSEEERNIGGERS